MVTNFSYDGIALSSFDSGQYVVVSFDTASIPSEGQRNVNQMSMFMGKEQPFLYQTYDSTLTFSITIIKNPCFDTDGFFTVSDMEKLKRWLCRPAPHKFKIIEDSDWGMDYGQYQDIYWEGSFNITEEVSGSKRIGLTLNFISTRPFGLQENTTYMGSVNSGGEITIYDTSTEIGYLYPEMTVTCLEAGDLAIYNDFEGRETIVANCSANEIITFTKYLQIETNKTNHAICDDFNYIFLRIGNNFATNENIIGFSLDCDYRITYNPIRKVIPV